MLQKMEISVLYVKGAINNKFIVPQHKDYHYIYMKDNRINDNDSTIAI